MKLNHNQLANYLEFTHTVLPIIKNIITDSVNLNTQYVISSSLYFDFNKLCTETYQKYISFVRL